MFGSKKKIITRIAPSPTGHLHIGTVRTALYNYLYAKQHEGEFIMRIEDTDKARSKEEYTTEITEGLNWLGIIPDAVYKQSERSEIYKKYLEKIIKNKSAYISEEESKREPGTKINVIRLKNPNKEVTFTDEIRGEITFDTTELGDFVIARSIDDPLYHFAVVVDDYEMKVTHLIRGEDHISNTPRQILIQEAIGAKSPIYAHLPLILAADKSKLSKRHGAVSLFEYKEEGFLPSTILNYLSLLGWNPGTDQEIFSFEELIEQFSLSGVQKGGAVFDKEKMKWVNKEHFKLVPDETFLTMIEKALPDIVKMMSQFNSERLSKLLPIIRERVTTSREITDNAEAGEYDFAFSLPSPSPSEMQWKKDKAPIDALPRLQKAAEILASLPEESEPDAVKNALWGYAEDVGRGELLWPLRVALTGKKQSPDPFIVIHIIGSAEAYKRVKNACDTILNA